MLVLPTKKVKLGIIGVPRLVRHQHYGIVLQTAGHGLAH
jgi:hypothetical protein